MKRIWMLIPFLFAPAAVLAGTDGYAGLSYVSSSIAPDHATDHANTGAVQFNFGAWLNQQGTLGAEGRIGLGVKDGNVHYTFKGEREVSIDRYYGAYLRAQFPESLPVRPYGLVGLTRIETDEKDASTDHHDANYSDLSLGLGVDLRITKQVFVNVEYLRVVDHGGDEINHLGIGVGGRF